MDEMYYILSLAKKNTLYIQIITFDEVIMRNKGPRTPNLRWYDLTKSIINVSVTWTDQSFMGQLSIFCVSIQIHCFVVWYWL